MLLLPLLVIVEANLELNLIWVPFQGWIAQGVVEKVVQESSIAVHVVIVGWIEPGGQMLVCV